MTTLLNGYSDGGRNREGTYIFQSTLERSAEYARFIVKKVVKAVLFMEDKKAPSPKVIPKEILKHIIKHKPNLIFSAFNACLAAGGLPSRSSC